MGHYGGWSFKNLMWTNIIHEILHNSYNMYMLNKICTTPWKDILKFFFKTIESLDDPKNLLLWTHLKLEWPLSAIYYPLCPFRYKQKAPQYKITIL